VFDPFHPLYFDEADLHSELARVQSVCSGCRACITMCDSFPRLFDLLDGPDGRIPAGLSKQELDSVIDGCFDCGLCVLGCPDAPIRSETAVDVPRLMARARQARRREMPRPIVTRAAAGLRRVVVELGRPRRRTRFSTWMAQREANGGQLAAAVGLTAAANTDTQVTIFPTCHVEHHDPAIGQAMVGVLQNNGVGCGLPEGLVCCGAPQLARGDLDEFIELGRRNVRVLADSVRAGREVLVPLPSCATVLQRDYVSYVGGSDAELVAQHTHDASAYLLALSAANDGLPALVAGEDAGNDRSLTMHISCRSRTDDEVLPSVELLRLAGFDVTVVAGCASPDVRSPDALRHSTTASIAESTSDGFLSECPSAMGAIAAGSNLTGQHPLVVLARAQGIPGV
jgi:Fe-S oxidoreductase